MITIDSWSLRSTPNESLDTSEPFVPSRRATEASAEVSAFAKIASRLCHFGGASDSRRTCPFHLTSSRKSTFCPRKYLISHFPP